MSDREEVMPDRGELPLDVLDQIDRICDRFEAAWESGERPRVEDDLGAVAAAYRPALLRDLLAAELEARRRRGESPEAGEYTRRFPGDTRAIAAAFAGPPGPARRLRPVLTSAATCSWACWRCRPA
jgi:serine/threonine-protein kinase